MNNLIKEFIAEFIGTALLMVSLFLFIIFFSFDLQIENYLVVFIIKKCHEKSLSMTMSLEI